MKDTALYEKSNRATGNYPFFGTLHTNINFINHFHEELEIVIVLEGIVQISTEDGLQPVEQDEICFIMPGEIHGFISAVPNCVRLMKVPLVSEVENVTFPLMRMRDSIVTPVHPYYHELRSLLFDMIREHDEKAFGYEFAVKSAQFRLITILLRSFPHDFINASENERIKTGMHLLKSVNEYIEEHYTHEIMLADIASHCKYSIYYFSHFFKDVTGISFGDYLSIFRLKKAAALMSATDSKMTEIAFACGFNNIRSFNRMFKKHFAATPTEYRKALGS